MKRILQLLAVVAVLALAFTACGDGNGNGGGETPGGAEQQPGQTAQPPGGNAGGAAPTVVHRDLGGIEIVWATWWDEYDTDTFEPANMMQQNRLDDRIAMERQHNFRFRQERIGGYTEVRDSINMDLIAGIRDYHIRAVAPAWFMNAHLRGLWAPLPMENFDADPERQWSEDIFDISMRDGDPHAWASGVDMAGGVFFNMRLFEEAGLPRDYLFTLQAEGRWDWANFDRVSDILTRDIDNDGINDTWAITSFAGDFLPRAIASNMAVFVDVDPVTGHLVNATQRPEFLEAVHWSTMLRHNMWTLHEYDFGGGADDWNFFIEHFNTAQGAMRIASHYVAAAHINPNLDDEWGFVAFPRGPRAPQGVHMSFVLPSNISAIPAAFSPEEVEVILYAERLWNRQLPDAEDDDWIFEQLPNFRDPRSVHETIVNFTRNREMQRVPTHLTQPWQDTELFGRLFGWRIWNPLQLDPATIIEEAQQVFNEEINRINAIIG